jgi:hypothetical protein
MIPALLALLLPLCPSPPTGPQDPPPQAHDPRLGVDLAAVAGDIQVTFDELDEVLIWRHGKSANGRETLRALLDLTLLDHLAKEEGLVVGAKQIAARWGELEREVQKAGEARDLFEYLAQNEIDPATFREHLRLSIVHETLARKALGLTGDVTISGEQQTLWLQGEIERRGFEELPHPWSTGVVARCGELPITRSAFAAHLRTMVAQDELGEIGHLLALEKALLRRMPDLNEGALDTAVAAELERRRERVAADPRYKGVAYEDLLKAQGLSLEALARDPGLRVNALARILGERTHDDVALRAAYDREREFFDARFGESVEVYALMLRGARFSNELNPRTFEEAEAELRTLRAKMEGLDDFQRITREVTEASGRARENGGHLGRITAGLQAVPESIRRAAFQAIENARDDEGNAEVAGTILGPIRIQGGALLLCLGERFPAPTWEVMSGKVAGELRRRMLDEVLPRAAVVMWFD